MHPAVPVPRPVQQALDVWLRRHDEAAPGLIDGLYLVGSVALGNWRPDSDIDIVAFTATTPDEREVDAMRQAHHATIAEVGEVDIDGPRLVWDDIAAAPTPLVRPWTLHGEFHHDDACFEINPVIWYTLAAHGVTVRGPAADSLSVHLDRADRLAFVQGNTAGYWRSMAEMISGALEDPDRTSFKSEFTAWSVLGVARMLYTARTGGITSKTGAGEWIAQELPEHRDLVEHALAIRRGDTTEPDDRSTAAATATFVDEIADLVATAGT